MKDYVNSARKAQTTLIVLSALCLLSMWEYVRFYKSSAIHRELNVKTEELAVLQDLQMELYLFDTQLRVLDRKGTARIIRDNFVSAANDLESGSFASEEIRTTLRFAAKVLHDLQGSLDQVASKPLDSLAWGPFQLLGRLRIASALIDSAGTWTFGELLSYRTKLIAQLLTGMDFGLQTGSLSPGDLEHADAAELSARIDMLNRQTKTLSTKIDAAGVSDYTVPGIGASLSPIAFLGVYLILSLLLSTYVQQIMRAIEESDVKLTHDDLNWIVFARPGHIWFPQIYLWEHFVVGLIAIATMLLCPVTILGISETVFFWVVAVCGAVYLICALFIGATQFDAYYNIKARMKYAKGEPVRFTVEED